MEVCEICCSYELFSMDALAIGIAASEGRSFFHSSFLLLVDRIGSHLGNITLLIDGGVYLQSWCCCLTGCEQGQSTTVD